MNNAEDRTVFNPLEQPVSSDWNRSQSQLDRTTRELAKRFYMGSPSLLSAGSDVGVPLSGFLGDGFKVRPTSPASASVVMTAGLGYQQTSDSSASIGGIVGCDDLCTYQPLPLASPETIAIDTTAPGTGNERWDLIEVRYDRRLENAQPVNIYVPSSKSFVPTTLAKTLAFDLGGRQGSVVQAPAEPTAGIGYKRGVVAAIGSAVFPSTTAGYVAVAMVYVSGATPSTFAASQIIDLRPILGGNGVIHVSGVATVPHASSVPTVVELNAPAGVQVALVNAGTGGLLVYITAGGGDQGTGTNNAGDPVMVLASSDYANKVLVGTDFSASAGKWLAVNGTLQSNLAGATVVPAPISVCVKQRIFAIEAFPTAAVDGGGGAINSGNAPDPVRYAFHAILRTRQV